MTMGKQLITAGKDYTGMLPIFRKLVLKAGAEKGDRLIWAGCPGTCYAMATFLSYGLRDLGLSLYFALDADLSRLWRLELSDIGVIATKKEDPVRAEIIVLMSGLLRVPFENTLKLVRDGLASDGAIIGETVVPGLFEKNKWDEQMPLRFIFEFSMENPTSFEVERTD